MKYMEDYCMEKRNTGENINVSKLTNVIFNVIFFFGVSF